MTTLRLTDGTRVQARLTDGTPVWGSGVPVEPPTPPWRPVTAGTRSSFSNGYYSGTHTETVMLTLMRDVDEIRLTYMAGHGNRPQVPIGNPVTFSATVNGQTVEFSGQPTGICPDGGNLTSDPIPVTGGTGDILSVATTATADRIPRGPEGYFGPVKVEARSSGPSILVIGSSTGQNPLFPHGITDAGLPVVNASAGGTFSASHTAESLDMIGMGGFTHAFLQVGINNAGHGIGPLAQGGIDLAWRLRDRGIHHITQMVWKPWTDSTDGWTTVEGQTPRHDFVLTVQDWLRAGAPTSPSGRSYDLGDGPGALHAGDPGHPYTQICDWGGVLADSTRRDVYRVDHGRISTDGLHINEAGYELARHVLREWAGGLAETD